MGWGREQLRSLHWWFYTRYEAATLAFLSQSEKLHFMNYLTDYSNAMLLQFSCWSCWLQGTVSAFTLLRSKAFAERLAASWNLQLCILPSNCNSVLLPPRCCHCVLQILCWSVLFFFVLLLFSWSCSLYSVLCRTPAEIDCHKSETYACFPHFSLPVVALIYTWEPVLCKHKDEQPGNVQQLHLSKGCFSVCSIP